MAIKANVTYRGTPYTGAVFQLPDRLSLMWDLKEEWGEIYFAARVWASQGAYEGGFEPISLPEWQDNQAPWDPNGGLPAAQAYAFVRAKLEAAGATNIVEV